MGPGFVFGVGKKSPTHDLCLDVHSFQAGLVLLLRARVMGGSWEQMVLFYSTNEGEGEIPQIGYPHLVWRMWV